MILYVESHFVLELALGQEQAPAADELLRLAEPAGKRSQGLNRSLAKRESRAIKSRVADRGLEQSRAENTCGCGAAELEVKSDTLASMKVSRG